MSPSVKKALARLDDIVAVGPHPDYAPAWRVYKSALRAYRKALAIEAMNAVGVGGERVSEEHRRSLRIGQRVFAAVVSSPRARGEDLTPEDK